MSQNWECRLKVISPVTTDHDYFRAVSLKGLATLHGGPLLYLLQKTFIQWPGRLISLPVSEESSNLAAASRESTLEYFVLMLHWFHGDLSLSTRHLHQNQNLIYCIAIYQLPDLWLASN